MVVIDEKYRVVGDKIINSFNGSVIPDDEPLFLLRGRDRLALVTLKDYKQSCIEEGCTKFHLEGIDRLIVAFEKFSLAYPKRMKQPGITEGK